MNPSNLKFFNCMYQFDLYNTTPLIGRWLFDAQGEFSDLCFEITRPLNYSEINLNLDFNFNYMINCFRFQIDDYGNRKGGYDPEYVSDLNVDQLQRLFRIVSAVRDGYAPNYSTSPDFVLSKDAFPLIGNDLLREAEIKKRKFFLMVARSVIFSNFSVEYAAARFKVNAQNVRIWISAFLTHGPRPFFYQPKLLSFEEEEKIVREHFQNGSSMVYTCARYLILNRNRFRRMLHRHRN